MKLCQDSNCGGILDEANCFVLPQTSMQVLACTSCGLVHFSGRCGQRVLCDGHSVYREGPTAIVVRDGEGNLIKTLKK